MVVIRAEAQEFGLFSSMLRAFKISPSFQEPLPAAYYELLHGFPGNFSLPKKSPYRFVGSSSIAFQEISLSLRRIFPSHCFPGNSSLASWEISLLLSRALHCFLGIFSLLYRTSIAF